MVEVEAEKFLHSNEYKLVIDVRTPSEFLKGHIPGAKNIPLFSDKERVQLGITYKEEGSANAINLGLKIIGPQLADIADRYLEVIAGQKTIIHCWRGGMRSRSVASLLNFIGERPDVLKGGYKSYRKAVVNQLAKPYRLAVLGGYTGSGKTAILHELKEIGEQVIDLEAIAKHKGSAFGNLVQVVQPSNEQFENELCRLLLKMDFERRIWVEDESRMIGKVYQRNEWFNTLSKADSVFINIPVEERADYLVADYTKEMTDAKLVEQALFQIKKRLGGQNYNSALEAFRNGDLKTATLAVLKYYDKSYGRDVSPKVRNIYRIKFDKIDIQAIAKVLKNIFNEDE